MPPRSPLFGTVVALNVCFVLDISGSMDTTFKTNTGETVRAHFKGLCVYASSAETALLFCGHRSRA